MDRPGHNNVDFFVGTEVEHTPAYNKKTLFVIGVHSESDIVAAADAQPHPIDHIYFGANHSFPRLAVDDAEVWQAWQLMIEPFLRRGMLCTLDIDVACAEGLLESGLTEFRNFVPMLSVKLPYIQQLGYNATIKLDDKDFAATNPGVWCHSLHALQDRNKFTDWSKYTKDEIVK
jgi:hypothetical protein